MFLSCSQDRSTLASSNGPAMFSLIEIGHGSHSPNHPCRCSFVAASSSAPLANSTVSVLHLILFPRTCTGTVMACCSLIQRPLYYCIFICLHADTPEVSNLNLLDVCFDPCKALAKCRTKPPKALAKKCTNLRNCVLNRQVCICICAYNLHVFVFR